MWTRDDYRIEVRICSEAIFSSGESESNIAHTKVLADRYGFVYFHAKSLKGQLKRQAFWLLEQYKSIDDQRAKSFFHSIVKLFGINQKEIDIYYSKPEDFKQHEQGLMKLSHLELDEHIRAYFIKMQNEDEDKEYYNLSPHELIEAQTHIRTGIQIVDGVVKDKMLTTFHTVRKGLVFYSRLSFDNNPSDYLNDLHLIIRSFRKIGAGIHRGRGEIQARFLVNGKEKEFVENS